MGTYLFLSCPPLLQFCLQSELILIVVLPSPGSCPSLGEDAGLHSLLLVALLLLHLLEEGGGRGNKLISFDLH